MPIFYLTGCIKVCTYKVHVYGDWYSKNKTYKLAFCLHKIFKDIS